MIRQGEVYWVDLGRAHGSSPSRRRPVVVAQDDRYNRSALATTIVATVTSNLLRAAMPGNVRLRKGEANLSKASVINVTQLVTIDKAMLANPIGVLRDARIVELRTGLALLFGNDPS